MKTSNIKHQTSKQLIILFLIGLTLNFSCKRVIEQEMDNKVSIKNDVKTQAILNVAEDLRKRFIAKRLMKTGGNTYSIDSGIYYLDVALNIQKSDAHSYTVEQDNFEKVIELSENQTNFSEEQLSVIFNNTCDFTDSVFAIISASNKIVNNITVSRLPIEDDYTQRKVSITIIIGRTTLNNEVYTLYKTTPIVFFNHNMPSLRYTYNGGLCSQLYYEHYWMGPHVGQQVDIHGNVLGYQTGAAIELEKAINKCYATNSTLPTATGPSTSKVIFMPEVVMVPQPKVTLQPWEFTLTSGSTNTYAASKHNPTRIFSFNDWDLNTIHANINVCLNGDMMNYYLNHAIDVIDEAKVIYPLGTNPSGISYFYKRMHVNAYFKSFSTPPSNMFERSYNWNGTTAIPNTWGTPSTDYYTYYKHTYRLFKATPATVADPNKM